jgi:hypothetical protein
MSLQFIIPKPIAKNNERTLIKGFGLPLVQRAILARNDYNIVTDTKGAESWMGTPIYDELFVEQPEYTTFEFNEFTNKYVQTSNVLATNTNKPAAGLFLNGVIIDATVERNIVKTNVMGVNGTVKEYINNGDIALTIRGYVASRNPDEYPAVEARLIKSYASAPVPLKVTSRFLNDILGITEIVVESCQLSQQQGMRNVQYFQWSAVSNIDYTVNKQNV